MVKIIILEKKCEVQDITSVDELRKAIKNNRSFKYSSGYVMHASVSVDYSDCDQPIVAWWRDEHGVNSPTALEDKDMANLTEIFTVDLDADVADCPFDLSTDEGNLWLQLREEQGIEN